MPKTKTMFLRVSLALLAVILCVAVIVTSTTIANAYTGSGTPSTTASIYNSSSKAFTASELKKLFTALGSTDGTYAGLPVATAQGQSVAGNGIIVELGGLKWIAVYYSKADQATADKAKTIAPASGRANDGDKVLTLWLANTSSKTYTWNQFYDTGTNTGANSGDTDYPSNNYGISYMRAVVLNNGGDYYSPTANGSNATAANKKTATPTTNSANNEFVNFTTSVIGLDSYIVSPRYMKWQYDGQTARNLKATSDSTQWYNGDLNNDAWGIGGSYVNGSNVFNWINKPNYTAWIDDLLWLPSITETGMDYNSKTYPGLWGTSKAQNSADTTVAQWSWLRSARTYNSSYALVLGGDGVGSDYYVSYTLAVRPALHLNLSSAAEAAGLMHSQHDLKWVDDGNGNHHQECTGCDYKTSPTPHTTEARGVHYDTQNHKVYCTTCEKMVTEAHKTSGNITDDGNHDHDGHWDTCSVCGDRYNVINHTWSQAWSTDNDEYHYKKCADCGEIYKEDHTVSTWTKQTGNENHTGQCDECGKQFTKPHNLVWEQSEDGKFYQKCTDCDYQTDPQGSSGETHEHTWSDEWTADESHHWHDCEDLSCTARNEVADHELGDWVAKDGEHYRECKVCHHKVREENHYLAKHEAEPATCKQTGIKEYWECLVCNKFFSDEAGEHEIEDLSAWKQLPEASGGGQTPTNNNHVWGSWSDDGNGNHERTCTLCEAKDSGAHNDLQHVAYVDAGKHGGYCDICQLYVEENHTATGDYADADKHDQSGHWKVCKVCNGKVNEVAHEFNEENWSASGGKHWRGECAICGQRFFEAEHKLSHIDAEAPTCMQDGHLEYWQCDECLKYFSNQEGTSEIRNLGDWLNNAGNDARKGTEHEWDEAWHNDGDGGHYHECIHNPAHHSTTQDHNYNGKYYDDGEGKHFRVCEDCGYETTHSAHSVSSWTSNGSETHTGTCSVCQLTLNVKHDWEDTYTSDSNGHWYACKFHEQGCTAQKDYQAHSVSNWTNIGENGHQGNCDVCNKKDITVAHNIKWNEDVSNKHYKTCEDCEYESSHDDHVVNRWVDSGNGSTHIGYCSVCGSEEATANHNWNEQDLKSDISGHWYECTDCKAKRTSDAVTHDWNSFEWTVKDGKHIKECGVCHQKYEGAHAKETIPQVDPTCKDAGTKAYYHCAVCDNLFSDEECTKVIENLDNWKKDQGVDGGYIPANTDAHVWGEWQLDTEKGEHYRQCTICQTEDTVTRAKHTVTIATKENDSEHRGYCTVCQQLVTAAHTVNGDFNIEGNHDLGGHWQICTVCKERINEQTHEWLGDWTAAEEDHFKTCETCGQEKREAHSVTEWTNANDSANHKGQCVCGKEIKQAHVLSELTKDVDGSKYYQKCTVDGCDYRIEFDDVGDVHTHTWKWNQNELTHWEECDCGAHRSDAPHTFGVWSVEGGNHSHTCSEKNCGYTAKESHKLVAHKGIEASCTQFGQQPYWFCSTCEKNFKDADGKQLIEKDIEEWLDTVGEGKIDKTSHSYDGGWLSNAEGHWKECTVCGNKQSDPASHVFGKWNEAGGQHYKECETCSFRTYEAHSYSATWQVEEGYHFRKCDYCDHVDEQGHNNGLAANRTAQVNPTESTPGVRAYSVCSICDTYFDNEGKLIGKQSALDSWKEGNGKINPGEEILEHEHSFTIKNQHDGVNHWDECACGARSNISAHQVSEWNATNATTHSGDCTVCGETVTSAHNLNNENTCEDCGYVLTTASDCNHVVTSGTSNGNETHTGVCEICGLTVSVAHVWSEDFVVDEHGHWHECAVCGFSDVHEEHELEWTTDGQFTHSGDCAVCGKHIEVEHTWLFGKCLGCGDELVQYSEGDIGLAAVAIVAQLFGLIAVAAIISRRMKR